MYMYMDGNKLQVCSLLDLPLQTGKCCTDLCLLVHRSKPHLTPPYWLLIPTAQFIETAKLSFTTQQTLYGNDKKLCQRQALTWIPSFKQVN